VSQLTQVTDGSFQSDVLNEQSPVLVDFYADWCGPCRAVAPALEELSGEFSGRVKIVKLNIDENEATSMKYGVQSIPTMILFKGGKEIERIIGALPKTKIATKIEPYLS
jgi:thioredoxin 1